ncbi:uncharacterized protein Tco025E_00655 [Trypanosoma conorhini]|uniref:Uncharacterized protein n=1 Tax=Trypanosoma conorhini TaxID=83891 RepID=A0A3R7LEZ5_9TRYP|nr:uncharacterized protein Tco025E_00655 [Trypanosoma conorhini]RNF27101.1 hypothetical protein Tco025E_00655 [Trypanosoma conorhini]
MADGHATYLSFAVTDCAPVDGDCVHSPDSVAWSPHNVLLVATHWALYLHINDIIASEVVLRPRYQPRDDASSAMCIAGAKWALDLVPEDAYPATCRLCVRTTRDLFIYRVIRFGTRRLRVSHGVCFIPKAASLGSVDDATGADKKGRKRARSSLGNPVKLDAVAAEHSGSDQVQLSAAAGWCVVSYEWFPLDLLVVVTLGGVYLLNFGGDDSDEASLQLRLFPPPAFRFAGGPLASLLPSCAARVLGCSGNDNRLVVACPCWLRVFAVSTTLVQLTHYVEVPSLHGIPTAVCSMMTGAMRPTLRVLVSAPMCVCEGSLVVGALDEAHGAGDALQVEWSTLGSWTAEGDLGDEIAVRRFIAVPLTAFAPLDARTAADTQRTGVTATDGCGKPYLVLGLCQRRLLGFVGRRCVELLRCMRMDGSVYPRDVALEISGATIHPSCNLAVLGIRLGMRRYPPFQLMPVAVNTEGGFLLRLMQLQEGFASLSDGGHNAAPTSPAAAQATTTALPGNVLQALWNRQQSTSYFVWEELLPGTGVGAAIAESRQREAKRASEASMVKEEVKGEGSGSSTASDYRVMGALRWGYLEQRQKYGLELFLRFPEANAAWRQSLLRIWRRGEGEAALMELVLANALRRMAEEVHYAGLTRRTSATATLEAEHASHLPFLAAVQFGRLYQQRCGRGEAWVYNGAFAGQLGSFIDVVEEQWRQQQQRQQRKAQHPAPRSSPPRFPCSVCGKEEQTLLTMSLSSNLPVERSVKGEAHDCATGFHLTVFSGSTFTPLSFVKQDEVLSRCLACGLYDYVTGPLCCVCEGLMM